MQLSKTMTLVTGANGALGLAICRTIQAEGGNIIATDVHANPSQNLKLNADDQYISADLTSAEQIKQLWRSFETDNVYVTGIVNNAGIGLTKPVGDILESEVDPYTLGECESAIFDVAIRNQTLSGYASTGKYRQYGIRR